MAARLSIALRLGAVAGLLACALGGAQARGSVSVDLSVGLPLGGAYYGGPVYGGPAYGVPAYGTVYGGLPYGAVNVQIGGARYWRHGGVYYRPWGPRYVVVAPPVVLAAAPVVVAAGPPPVIVSPSKADPIIYPRSGQDAQQTEADRQECNRWATTQPAAMADATVFQRAVEACMDGRGYSMK